MIYYKSNYEIERIREACKIVREVLNVLYEKIEEGLPTIELDKEAEKLCKKYKARPAFKGYGGFPKSVCVSLNEEVVHGIPSAKKVIKKGDLVKIDFGVEYKGFYGDAAFTKIVGKPNKKKIKLVNATKEALDNAINQAYIGNRLGKLSDTVEKTVKKYGFSVVRKFVGHGIGRELHEEPQVPNFGDPNKGLIIKKGLVIAIEPMVNEGTFEVDILKDGWTAVTRDRKLSAHFEHTVAVTENGPDILTL